MYFSSFCMIEPSLFLFYPSIHLSIALILQIHKNNEESSFIMIIHTFFIQENHSILSINCSLFDSPIILHLSVVSITKNRLKTVYFLHTE